MTLSEQNYFLFDLKEKVQITPLKFGLCPNKPKNIWFDLLPQQFQLVQFTPYKDFFLFLCVQVEF